MEYKIEERKQTPIIRKGVVYNSNENTTASDVELEKKSFKIWDLDSEMYNKIISVIADKNCLGEGDTSSDIAAFLISLDAMLKAAVNGQKFHLESKIEIISKLKVSYEVASKIVNIIQKELDVLISSDCVAFITLEVEKLRQLQGK